MNETNKRAKTKKISSVLFVCSLIFSFSFFVVGQKLPKEIRGYKVYQTKISVKNQSQKNDESDNSDAFVKIGEPKIADISITGITLEIPAEFKAAMQSGKVDFLTFYDFRVNGLAVNVEEYKNSFSFEKNKLVALPQPVKIFLGSAQTLRGAYKEFKESKDEWTITGRIFVFGRFKKSFLTFKRVVPIEINLKIKNPLKTGASKITND